MADPNKNPLRVQRYEDLTNPEIVGILESIRLMSTDQHNEAFRTLMVTLDLEHFIATLDLDPKLLTDNQREELLDLREQTFKITGQFIKLNILGELGSRSTVEQLIAERSAVSGMTPKGS